MKTRYAIPLAALALLWLAPALSAKEELVTLPERDTVQLTIYNSVDLTLVRETRTLSFKEGENKLQFSWANTLIDPTSVEFRAIKGGEKLEVLDTSFPPESREMLIWNISAEEEVSATVEISYFTSGISWSAEYVGTLASDESAMDLTAFVTVHNRSGEDYENAQVRLIVGSIHLVEEVAGLATGRDKGYKAFRRASAEADRDDYKKDIHKEGLSEYYIYTVGSQETVPNGWSKRLESFVQESVPVRSVYTWDPAKYGYALSRILTFKNDEAHKLGKEPLPAGVVRLYRTAGENQLSWVGQVATQYIAKNDEVKVNAGQDLEVTMKMTRKKLKKQNLVFQSSGNSRWLAGWDTIEDYELELKNFRDREVEFEINLAFNGDFDFDSELESSKVDYRTQRFSMKLKKGDATTVAFTVTTRNGSNAKNK